ncbi:MAG: hypothetical protein ACM3SU_01400 [Acidobacteriota bacterium]
MKNASFLSRFPALALAAPVIASLMLHTETTIPTPAPGETVELKGLVYKARFEAKITSVRLVVKTAADADPVVADWMFSGSNSDGQVHRVDLQVRLFDEHDKQLEVFEARHPLAPGARDEAVAVPMKVKSAVLAAAKKVRIWANWIT